MAHELLVFAFRWMHLVFGIAWIGLLYYFNFVQGEYFKEATPEAKADAVKKLAPRALWWFRWAAMFTFLTGLVLMYGLLMGGNLNLYIVFGATMATIMFLNVWLIIWPNQKIVCGLAQGNASEAGPKALLASRTNVLFSGPMAFGMLASAHLGGSVGNLLGTFSSTAATAIFLIIAALQANAIWGKLGPLQTVKGVIHCSIALAIAMVFIVNYA